LIKQKSPEDAAIMLKKEEKFPNRPDRIEQLPENEEVRTR
jgi:hypothetical protein